MIQTKLQPANIIERTYKQVKTFLKEKVASYIWNKPKGHLMHWMICMWSKHVSNGYIKTYGTESDKANLVANFWCLHRK